jgi:diguanylate cyclase (GGDEF)-like protein/PAS domain S-box-containing protein
MPNRQSDPSVRIVEGPLTRVAGAEDGVKVLLVDDKEQNLVTLNAVLEQPGVTVVCAQSGKQALRYVLSDSFAVILLDVNMPGMDGFETAELIRQRKASADIPIIFLTAHADDAHMYRGYSLRAVDYILTPVQPEILKAKVGVFVELSRKTNENRLQAGRLRDAETQLRLQAEKQLRTADERLKITIDSVQDYAILSLDKDGRIDSWNGGAARLFLFEQKQILGEDIAVLFPTEDLERGILADRRREAIETGRSESSTWFVRKDGSRFFGNDVLTRIRDENGNVSGFSEIIRDVTDRKALEEALFEEKERAQVTLNSIGDAVLSTDLSGKVTYLNLVAERMTGWRCAEAVGRPLGEVFNIIDGETRKAAQNPMELALQLSKTVTLPSNCILVRRDGFETPIAESAAPIHDRGGKITGAVIVFHDVSVERAMSLQLSHLAQYDVLTDLPNRTLLNDRLAQAIASAQRHGTGLAVLFVDLDRFKQVNDSFGHAMGDALLQSVAHRLLTCVRISDTVSRLGGDEFVIVLSELDQVEDAAITANKVLAVLASPYSAGQHDLDVTVSIGVSTFPRDGQDAETLIKNADTAMYHAKENGRNNYQFFEKDMNVRAVERQALESSLRHALVRREFVVHYQPKVNLETGVIAGAEALIRWRHPDRGLIPPEQFVPIAEDSGLILQIGQWVLREACRQARAWLDAGLGPMPVAINISTVEFRSKHFLEGIRTVLLETGLKPHLLELELTESVLMQHPESTASVLRELKSIGVRLAVDDFGTGYSSLSYLRRFPIDVLKLDRSFVSDIVCSESKDTAIVNAVITMGKSLKHRVIAEGVETEEQLRFLQVHRCDEGQGFYFSPPVAPEEFAKILAEGTSSISVRLIPGRSHSRFRQTSRANLSREIKSAQE